MNENSSTEGNTIHMKAKMFSTTDSILTQSQAERYKGHKNKPLAKRLVTTGADLTLG